MNAPPRSERLWAVYYRETIHTTKAAIRLLFGSEQEAKLYAAKKGCTKVSAVLITPISGPWGHHDIAAHHERVMEIRERNKVKRRPRRKRASYRVAGGVT